MNATVDGLPYLLSIYAILCLLFLAYFAYSFLYSDSVRWAKLVFTSFCVHVKIDHHTVSYHMTAVSDMNNHCMGHCIKFMGRKLCIFLLFRHASRLHVKCGLQCFDTVGWAAERASGL